MEDTLKVKQPIGEGTFPQQDRILVETLNKSDHTEDLRQSASNHPMYAMNGTRKKLLHFEASKTGTSVRPTRYEAKRATPSERRVGVARRRISPLGKCLSIEDRKGWHQPATRLLVNLYDHNIEQCSHDQKIISSTAVVPKKKKRRSGSDYYYIIISDRNSELPMVHMRHTTYGTPDQRFARTGMPQFRSP